MDIIIDTITINGSKNPTKTIIESLVEYDDTGNILSTPTEKDKWDLIRKS